MTTWAKLDDDYYDHPKFTQVGPMAELLWIRMLAWSHRNLTDGLVPIRAIKRLADFTRELIEHDQDSYRPDDPDRPMFGTMPETNWLVLVDRLLVAGLLDPDPDDPDAFRVHDYTEKQTTAETVEKRREAGRRGGTRSGEVRQKWQPNEATAVVLLEQTGKQNASQAEANGQPDLRSQISDTTPSSSSYLVVVPVDNEEESATPSPKGDVIRRAAHLHAQRALASRERAVGKVNNPEDWKAKAAKRWDEENRARCYEAIGRQSSLTDDPARLLAVMEGNDRPELRDFTAEEIEITDADRADTKPTRVALRGRIPTARQEAS